MENHPKLDRGRNGLKWPRNGENKENCLENPFPGLFLGAIFAPVKVGAVSIMFPFFLQLSGCFPFRTGLTGLKGLKFL